MTMTTKSAVSARRQSGPPGEPEQIARDGGRGFSPAPDRSTAGAGPAVRERLDDAEAGGVRSHHRDDASHGPSTLDDAVGFITEWDPRLT